MKEEYKRITELEIENSKLKNRLAELGETLDGRSDEWRIEQFNRNRDPKDFVSTIEEMESAVEKLFNNQEKNND